MAKKKIQISIPIQDCLWLLTLLQDGQDREIVEYVQSDIVERGLKHLTPEDVVQWIRDFIDGYDDVEEKREYVEGRLEQLSLTKRLTKQVKEQLALDLL